MSMSKREWKKEATRKELIKLIQTVNGTILIFNGKNYLDKNADIWKIASSTAYKIKKKIEQKNKGESR